MRGSFFISLSPLPDTRGSYVHIQRSIMLVRSCVFYWILNVRLIVVSRWEISGEVSYSAMFPKIPNFSHSECKRKAFSVTLTIPSFLVPPLSDPCSEWQLGLPFLSCAASTLVIPIAHSAGTSTSQVRVSPMGYLKSTKCGRYSFTVPSQYTRNVLQKVTPNGGNLDAQML